MGRRHAHVLIRAKLHHKLNCGKRLMDSSFVFAEELTRDDNAVRN